MNELLALAVPMLVLAGFACGWTAETASPAGGFGLRGDMAIGFAGSVALAAVLYSYSANWFTGLGLFATFLIGVAGAAGLLVVQRTLWPDTGPRR
jgi:uncharacterized membrane protein YeaQ/YmgE (transglycosylase-associated protein family)